ncbi:MAG: YceK/YidQ family lipoprotein [Planctomycetes bacterium]|nr:YceK/YidQ family lipoprotein [Planctomycetota bacterium]
MSRLMVTCLLVACGSFSGCGTLCDMQRGGTLGRRVMGGVRYDIEALFSFKGCFTFYFPPFDIPFSFVADVALLPVTVLLALRELE